MIISIDIYLSPYIWMYILRIVLIFGIFLCLGGFRCLNTPLSSESVYSLAFWIGMLLWFEAIMIAISLEILIFLGFFMGYLDLWVEKKSNSIYHLNQERRM